MTVPRIEAAHIDGVFLEIPDDDIVPVQKRGTASLAVRVPPINMNLGIEPQLSAIEGALAAAYRLMPFANLLKSRSVDNS